MTKIKVVDALPGTGKSYSQFRTIKSSPLIKWFYLTPLTTEITRIQTEVPERDFKAPSDDIGTKAADLLKLIEDGENIATTHALFQIMGPAHWEALQQQGYHVVSDEEVAAIKPYACNSHDVRLMLKTGLAKIEDHGRVVLTQPLSEYASTSFGRIAKEANKGTLYRSSITGDESGYLVTQLPIELFLAAKEVTILTYMFEGSLLDNFLKLYGIDWEYKTVNLRKTNQEVIASLKENIKFKTLPAIDALNRFTLTFSWYEKATATQLQLVGNAYRAVMRQIKSDESRAIVTLPKDNAVKYLNDPIRKSDRKRNTRYAGREKDKPISNCYLSARSRATNDYADRDVVIHLYNRNPNMSVVEYFKSYGFYINSDQFALSEMIQFVFRSAVRNGKPISLFVASTRMKKLLQDWLNSQEEEQQLLENYA